MQTTREKPLIKSTNGRRIRAESTAGNGPSFTLKDTDCFGFEHFFVMPCVLIGLGTTGTSIVRRIIDKAISEFGQLPTCVKYLCLDTKAMTHDRHRKHSIPLGIDGAGTNPLQGMRMFNEHFDVVKSQLAIRIGEIFRAGDARFSTALPPKKAVAFINMGTGFGGTSGGMLHPAINLQHYLAQQRNIENPRIHTCVMSPSVVLCDNTKNIDPQRRALIEMNYAENVERVLGEAMLPGNINEPLPDGTTVSIKARDRVFSLHKFGRTNGVTDLATSAQLEDLIAQTLYMSLFTQAGHFLDQRTCDIFEVQRLFS